MLVSRNDKTNHWIAREVEDCEKDFRNFVTDVIQSLNNCYSNCVSTMCDNLTCLDLESLVQLLCGERHNGKIIIDEGNLEVFGEAGFKALLLYICKQDHIVSAINDGELEIDPGLSHVLHKKLKQSLKHIIWEKKEIMMKWFQ